MLLNMATDLRIVWYFRWFDHWTINYLLLKTLIFAFYQQNNQLDLASDRKGSIRVSGSF